MPAGSIETPASRRLAYQRSPPKLVEASGEEPDPMSQAGGTLKSQWRRGSAPSGGGLRLNLRPNLVLKEISGGRRLIEYRNAVKYKARSIVTKRNA